MKLEKIIAVRTSKTVFRDGDKCVKVFGEGYSKAKILNDAAVHARIEECGLDIPKIDEVTKAEGKWAIVYDYVPGKTFDRLMEAEPEKTEEYLNRFIDAQLKINDTKGTGLPKLKERLAASFFSAGLSGVELYDLHTRLESLPAGDKICHGDFAPSNLIAGEDGLDHVVDWSHASQGDPAADAARSYLLFWLAGDIGGAEKYLSLYVEKSGISNQEAISSTM